MEVHSLSESRWHSSHMQWHFRRTWQQKHFTMVRCSPLFSLNSARIALIAHTKTHLQAFIHYYTLYIIMRCTMYIAHRIRCKRHATKGYRHLLTCQGTSGHWQSLSSEQRFSNVLLQMYAWVEVVSMEFQNVKSAMPEDFACR